MSAIWLAKSHGISSSFEMLTGSHLKILLYSCDQIIARLALAKFQTCPHLLRITNI